MRCGLYGKLPAKRDFIAVTVPREFLSVWEPWIQGGISASRMQLAAGWQEAFLRAPIWRFWLGAEVCGGGAVLGALMPSVDGVGRYFPLTVFARADPGEALPPPEMDAQTPWFEAAEDLLLSALSEGGSFDTLTASLERLPLPQTGGGTSEDLPEGATRLRDGSLAAQATTEAVGQALAGLRPEDHGRADSGSTFWWTGVGDDFPPFIVAGRRMPDPYLFTGMLTGRFEAAP